MTSDLERLVNELVDDEERTGEPPMVELGELLQALLADVVTLFADVAEIRRTLKGLSYDDEDEIH